ncbi:MAG: MFS transporter, partial [Lachnospiraceae bacterium]|nr:MFS transporter [Lachnospiraceae bacterium]
MKSKSRTAHYALICASYFAAYSSAHAYAAVFLLEKGFSNTMIGVVLALANVLSVVLQPISAGFIDKYKAFTNRKVSLFCAFGCLISSVILVFAKGPALIFSFYVLLYMLQMLYQPLIQAMNFEYTDKGFKINFGLARGLGSMGYAVASPFVGALIEKNGVSVLPIINILIFSIGIIALITFIAPKETEEVNDKKQEEIHNSFISLVKHYPAFMIFILGTTFL